MPRPACEIADIFRRYGADFQAQYGRLLGPLHLLVLKALAACRTAQLGGHRQRTLTLSATEFIRRFMMHVIPNGFVRIRYFGFLANAHRQEQLRKIRELLGAPQPVIMGEETDGEQQDSASSAHDPRCPHCKEGFMWPIDTAPRPRLSEILDLPLMAPT